MDKIFLTKEGFEEYNKEIKELRNKLNNNTKDSSKAIEAAVGDGWHDNFEFEESKRHEKQIMKDLETKISNLRNIVIVDSKNDLNKINVNDVAKVLMIDQLNKTEEFIFKLVGTSLPNIKSNISEVTLNSPLSKAVYQKKIGYETKYIVGKDIIKVKILDKIIL